MCLYYRVWKKCRASKVSTECLVRLLIWSWHTFPDLKLLNTDALSSCSRQISLYLWGKLFIIWFFALEQHSSKTSVNVHYSFYIIHLKCLSWPPQCDIRLPEITQTVIHGLRSPLESIRVSLISFVYTFMVFWHLQYFQPGSKPVINISLCLQRSWFRHYSCVA